MQEVSNLGLVRQTLSFLFSLLREDESVETFTPKDVARLTGRNYNTIRREMQEAVARGEIYRIERGVYSTTKNVWYRHYAAATAYCSNIETKFYAITFRKDDTDISILLFNALLEQTINRCGNHENTGYSVMPVSAGDVSSNAVYPRIEVGGL